MPTVWRVILLWRVYGKISLGVFIEEPGNLNYQAIPTEFYHNISIKSITLSAVSMLST